MRRISVVVLGLAVAACQAVPTEAPVVHLHNETNTPLAIHVNDAWVGTYPPGAVSEVPIPVQEREYRIVARSPTGTELLTLLGPPTLVDAAQAGDQVFDAWTDLRCGRITMSVGRPADIDRPPPNPPVGTCP